MPADALTITDTLVVDGLSQPGMTVSGTVPGQRVFDIASGSTAELIGLTISGGNADFGGGVYNQFGSVLTVRECALIGNSGINGGGIANGGVLTLHDSLSQGNSASFGGGVFNFGTMFVARSTISGNFVGVNGGGIYNSGNALVTESTLSANSAPNGGGGAFYSNNSIGLINTTLSGNVAVFGGGIYSDGATTVISSTLDGNTAFLAGGGIYSNIGLLSLSNTIVSGSLGGDCVDGGTTLADLGYNIVQDGSCITQLTSRSGNPSLGALADNGGPTFTHALLPGSIAIDAGDCAGGSVFSDQRGELRPSGVACDIGAFELQMLCRADLNADGQLNFFDVQQFLNYYATGDPRADFADDGLLDFFDVLAFLNVFAAGCP